MPLRRCLNLWTRLRRHPDRRRHGTHLGRPDLRCWRSHLWSGLYRGPHRLARLHGGCLRQHTLCLLALWLRPALPLPIRPGALLIAAATVACVTDAWHVTADRISARAFLPRRLDGLADRILRHEPALRLAIWQSRVRQGRYSPWSAGKRIGATPAPWTPRSALAPVALLAPVGPWLVASATPVTARVVIAATTGIITAVSAIASVAAIVPVTADRADR